MTAAIRIEILGAGCKNCRRLEANAKQAVASGSVAAEVVHITDRLKVVKRGGMVMPALWINDEVSSPGKVLSADKIMRH